MDFKPTITKEEIALLPSAVYEGKVVVVERDEDIDSALKPLFSAKVIGFDTETRPSFKKGTLYPVSMIQLGIDDYVVLLRLSKINFTKTIRDLLSNQEIVKVGVGIRDDLAALQKLAKFQPSSFIDLQNMVGAYGINEKSFAKLMAIIFGVHVSKRQRVSNWAADILTETQIRYAATDAWGAKIMYDRLVTGK